MSVILVGTDLSTRSDRALRRGCLLAQGSGAELLLVNVIDDDQPERLVAAGSREAGTLLAELSETIARAEGVRCRAEIRMGLPSLQMAEAALHHGAALIVIGPHRRDLLRDQFVGTTAERTIRRSPVPVLLANAMPAGAYHHWLFATDLTPGSAATLDAATTLAERLAPSARRSVLHAYDNAANEMLARTFVSPPARADFETICADDAAARLSALQAEQTWSPLLRPARGGAAGAIIACAEAEAADLIILARSTKSTAERAFLGSVATQILRRAQTDILVLPPPDPA